MQKPLERSLAPRAAGRYGAPTLAQAGGGILLSGLPPGSGGGPLVDQRATSACVALRRPAAQRLPARRMISEVVTKCWVKSVESLAAV